MGMAVTGLSTGTSSSLSHQKICFSSNHSTGLFAIFDGHGGIEIAEFCSRNFEKELKQNHSYQSMNYEQALVETFLRMDELLLSPEGKQEIAEINKLYPANVS